MLLNSQWVRPLFATQVLAASLLPRATRSSRSGSNGSGSDHARHFSASALPENGIDWREVVRMYRGRAGRSPALSAISVKKINSEKREARSRAPNAGGDLPGARSLLV